MPDEATGPYFALLYDLTHRRTEVIRLHTEGVGVMEIVRSTGLSWPAVNGAIKLWQAGGDEALQPASRGRRKGSGRKLTPQQEADLRQCIRRRPQSHGLKDLLWTRTTVCRLVKQKFDIELTERATGNYLERWGLVIADAGKKPRERCTAEVRQWLDTNYAGLFQNANDEDAEIYWVNKRVKIDAALWRRVSKKLQEDAVSTDDDEVDDLDDMNQMPVFRSHSTEQKVFIASATNNQGKLFWMLFFDSFGAENQQKFLRALVNDTARKTIFLIRNEMKAFARMGDEWKSAKKARLRLFPPLRRATP